MPEYPTLNGSLTSEGREIEVAFVGNLGMRLSWRSFVSRGEDFCEGVHRKSISLLERVEQRILDLHKSYFPGRWTGNARDLLNELRLRMICFYPDGKLHLWYQGSSVFNFLDVDIGLGATSVVTEVRFDG